MVTRKVGGRDKARPPIQSLDRSARQNFFANAREAETVELFLRRHTGSSSTFHAALMEYLSLPAQCFVTGTFVFTGLYTARSLIQLNRRIQQTKAALASMQKSLPVATAPVAAVLNLYPAIGGEASQAVEVPRGAAIDGPCQRRLV